MIFRGQDEISVNYKLHNKKTNTMVKKLTLILVAAAGMLFSSSSRAADNPALMEPVKSIYDHYLAIQTALAKDSTKELDMHANAIAKAVKGDDMKMLPEKVAKEAETLAK